MDRHQKQIILQNCNNVPAEGLYKLISEGSITLAELESHGLAKDKIREIGFLIDPSSDTTPIAIPIIPAIPNIPAIPSIPTISTIPGIPNVPEIPTIPSIPTIASISNSKGNETYDLSAILEQIKNKEISAEGLDRLIKENKLSYDDLEKNGIDPKVIFSLKFFGSNQAITRFYGIKDLPEMEEGRTDVYMVGMAASGKSTMLSGIFKYVNDQGIFLPDPFNQNGNAYMEQLKRQLDYGVLPVGTAQGSYNYIATSFKDQFGKKHPFNIVEVPGENYQRMFSEGMNSDTDYIRDFVNYIKNRNKKILVFVIDSVAQLQRFTNIALFGNLDQSIAYNNILAMFREHKILDRTDAIYFVVNKFDVLKNERYAFDERPDENLALEFIEQEFASLLSASREARENSKNKFKIKAIPFSIGEVVLDKLLKNFDNTNSKAIVDNLLEDSFIVSGGAFWNKLFK